MLTDKEIQNAKPKEKPYRLPDGGGLYLEVTLTGSKLWRWKYRLAGKEKRLAIGAYPEVRAPEARKAMTEARDKLKAGIDPSAEKRAKREQDKVAGDYTFEAVARTWFDKAHAALAETTRTKNLTFLEKDVFPFIGNRPIADLVSRDLLSIIRRIDGRGANDIARRVHNLCGRIFRYAVGQRRKDVDASPYINHPLGLACVLADEGGVTDPATLCAALLHDTIEDTDTTADELESEFGAEILSQLGLLISTGVAL